MQGTALPFEFTTTDYAQSLFSYGYFAATVDISSAYRSVSVNPQHWSLQGIRWNLDGEENFLLDKRLCFGLKCAPFIFSQLSNFVVCCLHRRVFFGIINYLDITSTPISKKKACGEPEKLKEKEKLNETLVNLLILADHPEMDDKSDMQNDNQISMKCDLDNISSFKKRLKEYLLISNEQKEIIEPPLCSSPVTLTGDNCDQDHNNAKTSVSFTQIKRTLPSEADSSWNPAKQAQVSAIRCSHRADFLHGALKNGCIEEWAIQAKELPAFMMKVPNFKNEYYQLRLKHAKETMTLAIKHLQESAKADKRTAITLKGAAEVITEETLPAMEAKAAKEAGQKEWDDVVNSTTKYEVRTLNDRKKKLESKVLSLNDVINPANRNPTQATEGDSPAEKDSGASRQDFGRGRGRGRYRGRNRGRRNNKPYSRPNPKES